MTIVECISWVLMIVVPVMIGVDIWARDEEKKWRERKEAKQEELMISAPTMTKVEQVTYSNAILDYVRDFTMQITALKFRDFIDSHKVEKLNLGIFKNFAADTASDMIGYIDKSKIDFTNTLFTQEFLQDYIIWLTFNTIKSLIDKSPIGFDEE